MATKKQFVRDNDVVIIKERGVNARGFGHVARRIMTDQKLSITAKGIYSYLSAMAGSGENSFTSRAKILSHLNIGESAYDSNIQRLINAGYITRAQSRRNNGSFGTTVIEFIMIPAHLKDDIDAAQQAEQKPTMYSGTVYALGWGSVPRMVMQDPILSVKAKALYAYFCSYAGPDGEAFPERQQIMRELGIGKNMYNNYRKELEEQKYITVFRRHIDGKLAGCLFRLNQFPARIDGSESRMVVETNLRNQIPQNPGTADQVPQNQGTVTSFPQIPQNPGTVAQVPQNQCTVNHVPGNQCTGNPGTAIINTNNNLETNNTGLTKNSILLDRLTDRVRNQISYSLLSLCYGTEPAAMAVIDQIVIVITETLATPMTRLMIGGVPMLTSHVQAELLRLTADDVIRVMDRYLAYSDRVENCSAYLLSSLYNEVGKLSNAACDDLDQ